MGPGQLFLHLACESLLRAALVLAMNTLLRPLVGVVHRQPVDPIEQESRFALQRVT